MTTDIESTLDTLGSVIREAQSAFSSDRDPPPEVSGLQDLAFRTRKLRQAWGRPQSLGFFGPSQAGKSFLVGALLSQELGTLQVLARSGEVDFLKEINPAKGVESTGVVTRFSCAPTDAPLTKGDFHCRVLPLEVVLESMATGFLVECTAPRFEMERVDRVLREARLAAGPEAPEVYREAWDTVWHNLAKKYQDRHAYLNELRRHPELKGDAWKKGIRTASGWQLVYSLLWGGHGYAKDLDQVMRLLVQGHELLGHADSVEVDLEHVRASADGTSIIDAACLNTVGTPRNVVRVWEPGEQREVAIDPGVLAALIAEIRLPLKPVSGSLLDHADLLDFPGGRALRGINGFGPQELNTGNLENAIEVYKRGKLTFLFEQFSLDREITALVIASPGPTKPEAIQMQSQVERWIQIRHGHHTPTTAEEIERPSLFLALTKFDMSLGALRSDNAIARWDSRVEEACVEFWARNHQSWLYHWGGKNRPFTNTFWIRNPYADQMQALKPGDPDYDAVKQGYAMSRSVQTYIASPAQKWAAVEGVDTQGLPRSGIPLLASHLRAKLAEDVKSKELLTEARAIHAELLEVLRLLTPSRDEAEAQKRLQEHAEAFVAAIRQEMAKHYSGAVFGELALQITVPEDELEAEIRSAYASISPMSIKASDKVKKLMVHVLKYWIQQAVARLRSSELAIPIAPAERFVREVCTSKRLLPILGKSIFPYFTRSEVDYPLVAMIMQVKISDAMLDLFETPARRTPDIPVRLSFSEPAATGGAEDEDEVDWADVDFDDEPAEEVAEDVELVFAGNRYFEHWSKRLPAFYVKNAGGKPTLDEDPRLMQLVQLLQRVEAMHVGGA